MYDEVLRGRVIAQAFVRELEKVAAASSGGGGGAVGMGNPGEMGDPQMGALAGGVQNEAGESEEIKNEAMPAHGVVASRVTQLDPRRAVGVPVMQPPPGYVYDPNLSSFVPNQGDPGWMAQESVMEAARNKGWYDAGQQDTVTQQAQQQLDTSVQADMDQKNMQAQQETAEQQGMATAKQEGMMTAAKTQGKIQGQQAQGVGPPPTPAAKKPATPKAKSPKKPSASSKAKAKPKKEPSAGAEKGVTIRIGR